jgi:stage V sporulation protein B
MGQQVFMFKNSLVSSVLNIAFIFFLVPLYGLNAFIAGWMVSLVVAVTAEIIKVKIVSGVKIPIAKWFLKPSIAAVAAGLIVNLISNGFISRYFGGLFALGLGVAVLGAIFCLLVVLLGVISISDIMTLFKGLPLQKLLRAAPKDKSLDASPKAPLLS